MSEDAPHTKPRRLFLKHGILGGCGLALGTYYIRDLVRRFHSEAEASALSRLDASSPGPGRGKANLSPPASLPPWAREAQWYGNSAPKVAGRVSCLLCPHECAIDEGDRGNCRTRIAAGGKLYTAAYGNPCSTHVDPVEKKPLYHFLPGSLTFSMATAGCNLRCLNCQNWEISQSRPEETENLDLPPKSVVATTKEQNLASIAYTYSEPIVFYEYMYDTALLARDQGIRNIMVTAGYINPQPLRKLCQVIDAAHVDLKGFSEQFYKTISRGTLSPVLKTLEILKEQGVWFEIIRLVVPTISDDMTDFRKMARWIRETLGPGTPLHLSRFHPAHKLTQLPPTPLDTLREAEKIAKGEGLHFVYIGNVPGDWGQDTICPGCKVSVIRRRGYTINSNALRNGKCECGEVIPGVWS